MIPLQRYDFFLFYRFLLFFNLQLQLFFPILSGRRWGNHGGSQDDNLGGSVAETRKKCLVDVEEISKKHESI